MMLGEMMMMMVMVTKMMMMMMRDPPIMDTAEGLFVCDIVHEDETHGSAVVRRRYRSISLLARRVLAKQFTFIFSFFLIFCLLASQVPVGQKDNFGVFLKKFL